MAEEKRDNIFGRLGKLFQSNLVIRKKDNDRLIVKDVDFSQTKLDSNFIDRYNRLHGMHTHTWGAGYAGRQNQKNAYDVARRELFRDYELMDSDPIIASALDIYSDESTVSNVENQILEIKTENVEVKKILHNLFYDVLNIEFNLWSWIEI